MEIHGDNTPADWRAVAGPSLYGGNLLSTYDSRLPVAGAPYLFLNTAVGVRGVPALPSPIDRSSTLVATEPTETFRQADLMLKRLWPEMRLMMGLTLHAVYALKNLDEQPCTDCWGCISGHDWDTDPWTIYVWSRIPDSLAEGWIHETSHCILHALGVHLETWDDRLLLNDFDEVYESPVRKDKLRPAGAVLQGMHSYIYVVEWQQRVLESGNEIARAPWEMNKRRLEEGLNTIDHNLRFTEDGKVFWQALTDWTVRLLETRV